MRKFLVLGLFLALGLGVAPAADAHRVWNAKEVRQRLVEHGTLSGTYDGGMWGALCGNEAGWNCIDGEQDPSAPVADENTGAGGNEPCILELGGTPSNSLRARTDSPNCPQAWLSDLDHNGTTLSGSHSYQFRGRFIEYEDASWPEEDFYDPECRVVHIRGNVNSHSDLPTPGHPGDQLPYVWRDTQYRKTFSKEFDCDKDDGTGNNPAGVVCYAGATNCDNNLAFRSESLLTDPDDPGPDDNETALDPADCAYAHGYTADEFSFSDSDGSPPSGWSATATDANECKDAIPALTDNVQTTVVSTQAAVPNDGSELYNGTETIANYDFAPEESTLSRREAYGMLWDTTVNHAATTAAGQTGFVATDYTYSWAGTGYTSLYGGTDASACITHTWTKVSDGGTINVTYCDTMYEDYGDSSIHGHSIGYGGWTVYARVDTTS